MISKAGTSWGQFNWSTIWSEFCEGRSRRWRKTHTVPHLLKIPAGEGHIGTEFVPCEGRGRLGGGWNGIQQASLIHQSRIGGQRVVLVPVEIAESVPVSIKDVFRTRGTIPVGLSTTGWEDRGVRRRRRRGTVVRHVVNERDVLRRGREAGEISDSVSSQTGGTGASGDGDKRQQTDQILRIVGIYPYLPSLAERGIVVGALAVILMRYCSQKFPVTDVLA